MDTELNLYLAGPMTGHPAFNYYEFSDWATALRYHGFDVVSPAESDDPEVQRAAYHSSSGDVRDLPDSYDPHETMVRNVTEVTLCDGVAVMPGWCLSLGARHEVETAVRLGLPVAPVQLWLAATGYGASEALTLDDPREFVNEEVLL